MTDPVRLDGLGHEGWRALLGRKVSIRFHLRDDSGAPFSEAIGVVVGVEGADGGARIRILSKRGRETELTAGDVIAGKVFPLRKEAPPADIT